MSGCFYKKPDEPLRQKVAFTAPLLTDGETVIGDAGWLVQRVNPVSEEAHVIQQSVGEDWTEAVIDGGNPGETYLVTSQAETSSGRIVKRSFVLRIAS